MPRSKWLSATRGAAHDTRRPDNVRVGAAEAVVAHLRSLGDEEKQRLGALAPIERHAGPQACSSTLKLRSGRHLTVGLEAGRRAAHDVTLDRPGEG